MLASTRDQAFDSDDFLYEVKWDGMRILAFCERGKTRLYSRSRREVTHQFPEFAGRHESLRADAVLDCEIVAMDETGKPSFERLQSRIGLSKPGDVARGVADVSLDLICFDLLHMDGGWLGDRPLTDRLGLLESEVAFGGRVLRSDVVEGQGVALFEAVAAKGLEGIVAKRRSSRYLPGTRSKEWFKVKTSRSIDCVIGGWKPSAGHRDEVVGSLLVGAYDDSGLRYLGSVGTGFDEKTRHELTSLLRAIGSVQNPFSEKIDPGAVNFVEPQLVCTVEYRELTRAKKLRAPSFKGLRTDKAPAQCLLIS
ncbi:MAG TPA: non-homologous end-joining DNA ligase [Actinomycetota bacterium]|nr:non-homologous end-joining DNA ligase [Actinomycetota bacterium]